VLGSHIGRRPQHRARARDRARALGREGDPQINELHLALVGQQDVGRLHVAVDDPVPVGVVERVRDAAQRRERPPGPQRALPQDLGERRTLDVLHHDQDALGIAERVVDRHEVGVVERGSEPRLPFEPARHVLRAVGVQALERDQPAEALVLGQEHRRHAARAEAAHDAVAVGVAKRLGCVGHLERAHRRPGA
jgi:hypothetical protein